MPEKSTIAAVLRKKSLASVLTAKSVVPCVYGPFPTRISIKTKPSCLGTDKAATGSHEGHASVRLGASDFLFSFRNRVHRDDGNGNPRSPVPTDYGYWLPTRH